MAGSVKAVEFCFSLKRGREKGIKLWCSHPQPFSVIEWNFEAFCVYIVNVDNKANILSLLNALHRTSHVHAHDMKQTHKAWSNKERQT